MAPNRASLFRPARSYVFSGLATCGAHADGSKHAGFIPGPGDMDQDPVHNRIFYQFQVIKLDHIMCKYGCISAMAATTIPFTMIKSLKLYFLGTNNVYKTISTSV